jgi:threonine/homoserine/homoserine lactone efflux protein
MSKTTERLLQTAAAIFIIYFAWQIAQQTIVTIVQQNQRATIAEQKLAQCEAGRVKQ